jgi:hypothetical protein
MAAFLEWRLGYSRTHRRGLSSWPSRVDERHLRGPVADELKAMARRVGVDAFVRQQKAILGRPDSRGLLPTIDIPTLIAVGDGDALTPPSESIAMFRPIPNPTFHLFHRCGHLPAMEQPETTTAVLKRWLTAISAGRWRAKKDHRPNHVFRPSPSLQWRAGQESGCAGGIILQFLRQRCCDPPGRNRIHANVVRCPGNGEASTIVMGESFAKGEFVFERSFTA